MQNGYSTEDLLDFLTHASDRGLMPTATAQALAVASRNVLGVLADDEKSDLRQVDLAATISRFENKRARDFSPSSLKEYGRRLSRAVAMFLDWREKPADFTVKTRATKAGARRAKAIKLAPGDGESSGREIDSGSSSIGTSGPGYQSAFPVRAGVVVTIANLPPDLTSAEAERLAGFVRLLAVE